MPRTCSAPWAVVAVLATLAACFAAGFTVAAYLYDRFQKETS